MRTISKIIMATVISVSTFARAETIGNGVGDFLLNKIKEENPGLNDAEILIKAFDEAGETQTTLNQLPIARGGENPTDEHVYQLLNMYNTGIYDENDRTVRRGNDDIQTYSTQIAFYLREINKDRGPLLGVATSYLYSVIDSKRVFQGEKGVESKAVPIEIRKIDERSYIEIEYGHKLVGETAFWCMDYPRGGRIRMGAIRVTNPYMTADNKVVCAISYYWKKD